jgi:Peptidase propeptide and YPEB domain
MHWSRKQLIAGGVVLAVVAGGAGTAIAVGGGDDGDAQATGPGAEQAKTAALAITGGGTANSVERDSENGATWEVEVTKPDGNTVDVRLDANYGEVVVEGDSESPDDSDSGE